MRHISSSGRKLIEEFEGLRLASYLDAVNVWTIGYGHTKGVTPGLRISTEIASQLLEWDLREYEEAVYQELGDRVSQSCFDAYVSLAFNIGISGFRRSTTLRQLKLYLDNGDTYHLHEAWRTFLWWNKAGGRTLAGLTRRRNAEVNHWKYQRGE